MAALRSIPDWFVTSKMLEKFHDAFNANDNILFFEEDFSKVKFFADQMGKLEVYLYKINFNYDNNFDEDDSDTIIHV